MTTINVASVITDALTGRNTGNLIRSGATIQEALVGQRVGRLAPGVYNSIISEAVTGFSVGALLKTISTIKEVAGGKRVGQDLFPVFMGVIMEVIARDTSYKFISNTKDVLGSSPGAPVRVVAKNATFVQSVAQRRTTQLPSTVKSLEFIPQFFQVAAQRRSDLKPISAEPVASFTSIAAQTRAAVKPISMETVRSIGQVVALSRVIPHVPVSVVVTSTQRQLAAQHRATAAPATIRSAISTKQDVQIVALSRLLGVGAREDYVPSFVQVVAQVRAPAALIGAESVASFSSVAAQGRAAPVPADVRSPLDAVQFVQVVANYRHTYAPSSHMDVATQQSIVAIGRVPVIGYGGEAAQGLAQLAAQQRDVAPLMSIESASTLRQVAAQERIAEWQYGPEIVAGLPQIVAQRRIPGPLPPTPLYSPGFVQVAAQHRDTVMTHGSNDVATIQVMYALGRTTTPPGDTFEPGTGANAFQFAMVAAQLRVVETPADISGASRFVRHLASEVALGDPGFPPPTDVFSDAEAFNVLESITVVDLFGDKDAIYSDALAGNVIEAVAMGDVFGDKNAVISDAIVSSLAARLVVGDVYPDPLIPVSDAVLGLLAAQTVTGDAQFPNKDMPVSEVAAALVGAFCAVGEVFPDPLIPQSIVTNQIVIGFAILGDNSLKRLPLRENRRRPLISVSIS